MHKNDAIIFERALYTLCVLCAAYGVFLGYLIGSAQ